MIDLTAKPRTARVLYFKFHMGRGPLNLQPGGQVDFHHKLAMEDESVWQGPAKIVQVGPQAVIKWQDRFLKVRTQDLRKAFDYLAIMVSSWFVDVVYYQQKEDWYAVSPENPVDTVRIFAESFIATVVRLGWVFEESWRRVRANEQHSKIVWAILHIAFCGFQLQGCIGARVGCGMRV